MANKKKLLFIMACICLGISIALGITYAWFNYTTEGANQKLIMGDIYLTLNNGSDSISLTNMFPETKEEARSRNDNVIEFTISGLNESDNDIWYEIDIKHGDDINNKIRFNDEDLVFDLVEVNGNNETYVVDAESYSDITNRRIWVDTVDAETDNEIERTYKLRVWISENVLISDSDPNASYPATGDNAFKNHYASVKVNVFGDFTEKELPGLANKIKKLKDNGATYIASYDDIIHANPTYTTQDQVSSSATKQTVYYYTGDDAAANANVLFAGYCWQIIRTTDNGGVRLIYNGVAVNNKCETTRTATKGINAIGDGTTQSMSAATLFGRSYDYNLATGEFTIEDSTGLPTAWTTSDNNSNGTEDYKELIGTYTCLSNLDTCNTLYYVGSIDPSNSAQAYVAKYTIGDVAHFSQLGTSAFNPNYYSPALVGYMFNTEYDYKSGSKSGEYFTNAVWENGAYVLSNGNSGTAPDVTHHYICDSDCTKVRYYYYVSGSNYYILLENGKTVEDALKEMINYKANANESDENINVYNSAMKGYLDNWYKKNLTAYTNYLDQSSVYCNDRSIRNLGGWNPSGTSITEYLQFYQYIVKRDLNCVNETDRFATTNTKAKLSYPIGLLTEPERNLMTTNFAKTGQIYWGASPHRFYGANANVLFVSTSGDNYYNRVSNSYGARGVITLKPSTEISEGTGTYDNPYIVGPMVTRTN